MSELKTWTFTSESDSSDTFQVEAMNRNGALEEAITCLGYFLKDEGGEDEHN
jgi:hypothetical protein